MTTINVRREFGLTKVYDASGNILATFTADPLAAELFGFMRTGIAQFGAYKLYDMDRQQFDVGDFADLGS
jgi:hypothetical protein